MMEALLPSIPPSESLKERIPNMKEFMSITIHARSNAPIKSGTLPFFIIENVIEKTMITRATKPNISDISASLDITSSEN